MMHGLFFIIAREIRIALLKGSDVFSGLAFFVIAVSLFPFAIGVNEIVLHQTAIGILWVCAVLASQLSLSSLYARDYDDGSLEQYLLHAILPEVLVCAKALSHWCVNAIPLLLVAPLLGVMLGIEEASLLRLEGVLAIGTLILSLLGNMGAALTLGSRRSTVLVPLLLLPLSIPMVIFGVAAVQGSDNGGLGLLCGMLLLTLPLSVGAAAASMRVAVAEE
ncbi:MAG: ccmB [Rickettsiales bacterium]|jgi:heme exporter protein B|nr:ccmB [Rickettsiales bacterium]